MDKLQNWLIGGLIVGFIALGIFVVSRPKPVITERDIPRDNLGALTGPEIPYDYFSFGGVRRYAAHKDFATATTTLCSFLAPSATSTLVSATIQVTASTGTAIVLDLARSNSPSASTTLIADSFTLASGLKVSLQWATSTLVASSKLIQDTLVQTVFNNQSTTTKQYLNIKFGGGAGPGTGTHQIGGTCSAVWQEF
jgi:hypothetical protein